MIALKKLFFTRKALKWILGGLAVLAALRLYFVQEMIAALVIFGILFVIVGTVALVVFLVDMASQRTVELAETGTLTAAHAARRAWTAAAEASKKQLHRLRSQTAQ